jgi:hypothetical protein
MTHTSKTLFICVVGAALAFGCGKKDDKKNEGGEAPKAGAPAGDKAPAAKSASEWADIELPDLGLIANAPGDAKVSKMGGLTAMNYACQAMINEKGDMSPSYDNQLGNVEKGNAGGPVKEMKRKEKTDDDNWVIEYSTDKKWGYFSSRKIGDKVYSCSRVSSKEEGHACVVKVCESLKAK